MRLAHSHTARGGMTLVEVVVAIMLLSVSLLGLASLTVEVGTRGREVGSGAHRNADLMQQVNYYTAIPYDSLVTRQGGCTTIAHGGTFDRCVTIAGNGNSRSVTIIVTPADSTLHPDTVRLERAQPPSTNPFNMP